MRYHFLLKLTPKFINTKCMYLTMIFRKKIKKVSGSLYVPLGKTCCNVFNLKKGDYVNVKLKAMDFDINSTDSRTIPRLCEFKLKVCFEGNSFCFCLPKSVKDAFRISCANPFPFLNLYKVGDLVEYEVLDNGK